MRIALLFLVFVSTSVLAGSQCDVSLNYGVVVSPEQIRVLGKGGRTVYQVNGSKQLFVQGNWIELDQEQEYKLSQLSLGIHKVVPKMVLLANEGVELAVETIEKVYGGLVKDQESQDELQKSLKRVKTSVKEKFIRANDNFYMGPGRLEQVDELVDQELEEQIEQAISTSVGGVLSAIGGLVANEKSTEDKIQAIANQLESVGENIEQSIGPKAEMLKHKAKWFCNKFRELDAIEEELKSSIAALKPYDVLSTGSEWQP
ncbi:YggN family protein [Paraglaciecola aquimarina]|uniref:YggN family protein n=1 Tax=Paraglaciecola algarum TaxID=3050085 RepID=A0ABS9D8Y6_9ALTE|nr:YggN family protein [Paraglaciecola sp. G1-23]MCF2948264.1 YggN family protein [Paraglaciecola sp. G1-23]